jgi:diphosphomevalonate decarboxylase
MTTSWESPSNIALIKYWGKRDTQLPCNPSISFTLSKCKTTTEVHFSEGTGVNITLDGTDKPEFIPKIEGFLERIMHRHPWLSSYNLQIKTRNSFPHSSGIASSASGMSALSLCIVEFAQKIDFKFDALNFYQEASILSRLGSGSASRSIYGGLVVWGGTPTLENANDEYAIEYPHIIDPIFKNYCDVVLLVEVGEKSVSSTAGHALMENHPFRSQRFSQAHQHLSEIQKILKTGDIENFIRLTELEALTLHGLMMSSSPSYILMKPNTLKIIEEIREFRRESKLPLSFTLDAGANVHVLFPAAVKEKGMAFIKNTLIQYCKENRFIADHVGSGPKRLTNFEK